MNLTSVRRVKYALGVEKAAEDHILGRLVGAASKAIVSWLRREDQSGADALELKSRTEYLDPTPGEKAFYPLAYPITSVTSIYVDGYGTYTGSEQALDSTWYYTSGNRRFIQFATVPSLPDWTGFPLVPRGMRLIYTAGLAPDPVRSTWTATGADTLTVGKYVQGRDSLAIGRIFAADASSLGYECLAGQFQAEVVDEFARVNSSLQDNGTLEPTGNTATLSAVKTVAGIPQLSLAESHPALVEACEMHVRFLRSNRNNFENLTVSQDGATRISRADLKNEYELLPEIKAMLAPYRNNLVAV